MNEDSNVCIPRWLEGELLPDGYNEQPNPYAEMPTSKYNLRALVNYALSNGKMVTELSKEEADYFLIKNDS